MRRKPRVDHSDAQILWDVPFSDLENTVALAYNNANKFTGIRHTKCINFLASMERYVKNPGFALTSKQLKYIFDLAKVSPRKYLHLIVPVHDEMIGPSASDLEIPE